MHRVNIEKNAIYTYGSLMFGIVIGCLISLFLMIGQKSDWLDFDIDKYNITVIMGLTQKEIVFYILKKRILQIVLFILLHILMSYSIVSFLYCSNIGFYYGIMICNLIIKYGIHGFVYGLVCFFPHYVLYFMSIYLLGKYFNLKNIGENSCYKNMNKVRCLFFYLLIFLLISVALLWEIRFQKFFLREFFNI